MFNFYRYDRFCSIFHSEIMLMTYRYNFLLTVTGVLNATPWIRDDFLKLLASKTPGMSPYIESDRQTETEVV